MLFGEDFGQLAASGEYEVYKSGTTIAQLNAAIASLSDEEYYDSFLIANIDAVNALFTLSPSRNDERQYMASVVSSTSNLSYAIFWQQNVLYYRVKTIANGSMTTTTKSTSGTGDTLLTLNSWTLYKRQKGYDVANGDSNVAYAIAPVQTSLSSADKNYAVGEQFLYDGHLYKVTSAITSGAQIVIGTNAEAAGSVTEQMRTVGTVQTPVTGVKYVQWGKVVTVTIDKEIATSSSSWVTVCSGLPKAKMEVYGVARPNPITDTRVILMDVSTSGVLMINGSGTSYERIRGSITYITSD